MGILLEPRLSNPACQPLNSAVNSQRFPEIFGDVCKNKTSYLQVFVENCVLPFAPVGFRRKPEPVPICLLFRRVVLIVRVVLLLAALPCLARSFVRLDAPYLISDAPEDLHHPARLVSETRHKYIYIYIYIYICMYSIIIYIYICICICICIIYIYIYIAVLH